MSKPASRMDDKGRLTLPRSVRKALKAEPGDVFFFQEDGEGVVRMIKGENPFEALAEQAIRECEAGETITLDEFAKREAISLDQ